MPTPTDLVTDLPADFEVFGQAVDTSMADLKGGTTGQILSKATNADMDFTWITNDVGDITAVNVTSPITGGGSSGAVTIGVSAASTSASGVVQLNDSTSSTSTTLAATANAVKTTYDLAASAYAPAFTNNFYAGKNKIINGAFNIWQRGTSFNAASNAYTADRWDTLTDKTNASVLTTQQAFTAGAAPVAGYEAQYFLRTVFPSGGSFCIQEQRIEDVRTFAGQTVTLSFWAKADATVTIAPTIVQNFGSGGSANVETTTSNLTLTTSWVRYSVTAAIPSISGKTIGTSSYLAARAMRAVTASGFTIDFWGVQLEAGSVATPFQTASGSIGGELALCQRYYYRANALTTTADLAQGQVTSVTNVNCVLELPVTMRLASGTIDYPAMSNFVISDGTSIASPTSITLNQASTNNVSLSVVYLAFTIGRIGRLYANGTTSAYIGVNAEL